MPVVTSAVAEDDMPNWQLRTAQPAAVTVTRAAVVVVPVCGPCKIMFSIVLEALASAMVEPAAVNVSTGRLAPTPSPMMRQLMGTVWAPVLGPVEAVPL